MAQSARKLCWYLMSAAAAFCSSGRLLMCFKRCWYLLAGAPGKLSRIAPPGCSCEARHMQLKFVIAPLQFSNAQFCG